MLSIPNTGTAAWIEVSNSPVPEYSVKYDESGNLKATCFIESKENEEFGIHVTSASHTLSVKVMIDGEEQVGSRLARFHQGISTHSKLQ